MIYYLSLFLICWCLIFTAARFLNYYRIERDYQSRCMAKVTALNSHEPQNKREAKRKEVDVTLAYEIDGKSGSTELTVPADSADRFELDKEIPVRYMVSGNGAVHLASDTKDIKRLVYGHGAALIIELAAFAIIWSHMV